MPHACGLDLRNRIQVGDRPAAVFAALDDAKLFDDLVSKLKKMTDTGKVAIAARHGQIVLLLETDVLFDVGKTEIKPDGVQALTDVAQALRTVQGRRFVVIGHTDTYPIQTKEFPSNWELGAARALVVLRALAQGGVPGEQLSAMMATGIDGLTINLAVNGHHTDRIGLLGEVARKAMGDA